MKLALFAVAAVAAARPALADPCADAVLGSEPDRALEERCLASHPSVVGVGEIGLGFATTGSSVTYMGALEIPAGPLRFEARGRGGMGAAFGEALVGIRIRYHYGRGEVSWTSSTLVEHHATYDLVEVTAHSAETMIRAETYIVGGMRGMYLEANGTTPSVTELGKTFELGLQHEEASGFGNLRRWELLGVLRGTRPGGVLIVDESAPTVGHLVLGAELGVVPYELGSPATDHHEVYVTLQVGYSFET